VHNINDVAEMTDGDICHLHHFFHLAFVLPETALINADKTVTQKPVTRVKSYKYNLQINFLKPPINL
jgi:hypothetical protein